MIRHGYEGETVLIAGRVPGKPSRLYRLALGGKSTPIPISPEGLSLAANAIAVSPDGIQVVVLPTDGLPVQFPVGGGEAQP